MNRRLLFVTVCALILFQACASPSPAPVVEPTMTATLVPSTSTPTPTVTTTSTPTPIPLVWTQVYDGRDFERDTVTAFATDKTDPNIIYAGMKNSGVYKTVDEGLSWQPVNQGLASKKVESLLIDSQNPFILYAGTIGGIFKTEDGGKNWSRVGEGTYLLMDWQDNSHLYARDENGIYETTDQGNSWEVVHFLKKDCPDEVHSWAIHPANGNTLFVGGGNSCAGIYQSSNNGYSWTLLGLDDKPVIDALAIGFDKEGTLSIYTDTVDPLVADIGVYISDDKGKNWLHQTDPRCNIFAVDPHNSSAIYCGDLAGIWVRQSKGDTWKIVSGTNSIAYSTIYIDHPNKTNRIISSGAILSRNQMDGKGGGIFIFASGENFGIKRNNGIGVAGAELQIDSLDNNKSYLATYYTVRDGKGCNLYHSLESGKTWESINSMGRSSSWCGPTFDSLHVLYMNETGHLQRSWDGGESWLWDLRGKRGKEHETELKKRAAYALPNSAQSVSANPYVDGYIYSVGDSIYYTTGSGWQLSTGSEGSWDARLFYTKQSEIIFAIGRYHQKYSTDNGVTWQACGEDVTTSQSDSRMALDLQGNKLYLATPGRGVLVSVDKCGSWQESNSGLGNLFVNTIAMDPKDNNILYAGTDGGAYATFDGGATWGQVNDGLTGSTIVYSIAVDSESNVYAATPYGVFKLGQK